VLFRSFSSQLPGILAKDKVTIVVTPLLALMLEQVRFLDGFRLTIPQKDMT